MNPELETESAQKSDLRARDGASPARLSAVALVVSALSIAWFFLVLVRDAEAAEFTRLDCSRSRLEFGPGWVDPRWSAQVAEWLAELPARPADDPRARAEVAAVLAELPFVAEVRTVRVVWPDGLEADVRLRQPIACARVGEHFVTVAEDGVVLPGLWSAPPQRDAGHLPLVALEDSARREVVEGGVLTSDTAVDGLSVAAQLWRLLQPADWRKLGRFVIDARHARAASVEEPGTVLWMESGRRVLFGRTPNLDAPGELPVEQKCASLTRALSLLGGTSELDWELADVRWDRAELLPRGGLDADPQSR